MDESEADPIGIVQITVGSIGPEERQVEAAATVGESGTEGRSERTAKKLAKVMRGPAEGQPDNRLCLACCNDEHTVCAASKSS